MSTEDFKQMVTPCDDPYPVDPTPAPVPTPDEVATPRTEAFINSHHAQWPQWDWQDHASAYADFARTLERELAEAKAELNDATVRYNEAIESEHAITVEYLNRAEKAESDLATIKAALAEAQKDKERLDWLEGIYGNVRISSVKGSFETLRHTWDTKRMRKHIDVARRAERGEGGVT